MQLINTVNILTAVLVSPNENKTGEECILVTFEDKPIIHFINMNGSHRRLSIIMVIDTDIFEK